MPVFTTALLGGLAAQGLQVAEGIDQANQAKKARRTQEAQQNRLVAEQEMQARKQKQQKRALQAQQASLDPLGQQTTFGRSGGSLAPSLGVPGTRGTSRTILGG